MKLGAERIVVADNHPLCRAGLASLLGERFTVGEIVQASDFVHLLAAIARAARTTLVSVNLNLPGMKGVAGLGRLRAEFPGLLVVVVAESRDRERVLDALGAGVHGYIPKATPADAMARAFANVLAGQVHVPSLVSDVAARPSESALATSAPKVVLTERQHDVLNLVAAGRSNKQIARTLDIAEGTVKVHIAAAFRALGVHNRVSAAAALRSQPIAGEAPQAHAGARDGDAQGTPRDALQPSAAAAASALLAAPPLPPPAPDRRFAVLN